MGYVEELESLGVDVTEGVDRVMGDEDLYEMMLGIFVDTVNETPIAMEEFAGNDLEELASKVHTMKGMTGNLSLTPLFNAYVEMLGLLRDGRGKEAGAVMEKMLPIQQQIMECIEKHRS